MREKEKYMKMASVQAKKAERLDEVPIGCVIVHDGMVVGRGYNRRNIDRNTLSHAELNAIKKASRKLGDWRLDDCEMYVTTEPCQMCAGALQQAKIKRIVFGAKDYKNGACGGLYDFFFIPKMNYYPLISYLENDECLQIIKEYFIKKRKK